MNGLLWKQRKTRYTNFYFDGDENFLSLWILLKKKRREYPDILFKSKHIFYVYQTCKEKVKIKDSKLILGYDCFFFLKNALLWKKRKNERKEKKKKMEN